jgi:DNA repair photolyase
MTRVAEDDGWDLPEDLPPLRTEVRGTSAHRDHAQHVARYGFDRSINPYRGCEHGCIYCFARPSHAYLGLSPGLDFETQLIARPGIAAVLEAELRKPRYRPAPIAIGTNTDPYQPVEAERRIMRGVLEVLQAFGHPVTVTTKGALIERDADILGEMGQAGLAQAGLSVTTLDAALARRMEPRCPSPARGCGDRTAGGGGLPGAGDGLADHPGADGSRAGGDPEGRPRCRCRGGKP